MTAQNQLFALYIARNVFEQDLSSKPRLKIINDLIADIEDEQTESKYNTEPTVRVCSSSIKLLEATTEFEVRCLLRLGANPNYQNQDGNSCLHIHTDYQILVSLINSGARPRINNKGQTILHRYVSTEVARLFLHCFTDVIVPMVLFPSECPVDQSLLDKTAVDNDNCNILYYLRDDPVIVELLLPFCSPDLIYKLSGETLLHGITNPKSLNLILAKSQAMINHIDNIGFSPLFHQSGECLKLLLEHGADPNLRDRDGDSSICLNNTIEDIGLLLKSGADINNINDMGQNTLFGEVNSEIIRLFYDAGINMNLLDNKGQNALFQDIPLEAVVELLKLGVDPFVVDKNGVIASSFGDVKKGISMLLKMNN
jgi:ankyrin repeat protein